MMPPMFPVEAAHKSQMPQRGANLPSPTPVSWVRSIPFTLSLILVACLFPSASFLRAAEATQASSKPLDFNRDVRKILSDHCFKCHGPDGASRKGGKPGQGLRLDVREAAMLDLGGPRALVPGQPDQSELIRRVETQDADDLMPPAKSGPRLTTTEIATLRRWIQEGAPYSVHWAYAPPVKPAVPNVSDSAKPHIQNPIDSFIVARLEREGLGLSSELDRPSLLRRVSLDLTGLPPTPDLVAEFVEDKAPGAYERVVDKLLASDAYGEHWARLWLDQARYADSSGYADDPPRTIWAYRDYVIRALNANMSFEQFTLEQMAGDLLPDPTDEQRVATAFHRNTMTNNEGGTNDEEFRNVAVVDRVNTTMSVWMGTTFSCAQCHDHKYDPISQEEYFRVFAILNNSADADRTDESPILSLYTAEQKRRRSTLQTELASLEAVTSTMTDSLRQSLERWTTQWTNTLRWDIRKPVAFESRVGTRHEVREDGSVVVDRGGKTDAYKLNLGSWTGQVHAARIEVLPDERPPGRGVGHAGGNFLLTGVHTERLKGASEPIKARHLRVQLMGREKFLSLAEVQIFSKGTNVAPKGVARQSSTAFGGDAARAIDGKTDGDYEKAQSTTHTESSTDPWWEVDLGKEMPLENIRIWNRTDGASERLRGFVVTAKNASGQEVWSRSVHHVPSPSASLEVSAGDEIKWTSVKVDHAGKGSDPAAVLENRDPSQLGWSVAPELGVPHQMYLVSYKPFEVGPDGALWMTLEQLSKYDYATLARFRISTCSEPRAGDDLKIPSSTRSILRMPIAQWSDSQRTEVERYFLSVAAELAEQRARLVAVRQELAEIKPYTTVPVMNELRGKEKRVTHLQRRGNFMDWGPQLSPGLPSALIPAGQTFPAETGKDLDRLALARWLVDRQNPLTARVVVNRFWETLFGIGLVRTSEEFGSQGELPSHPELLDWLAVEFMDAQWDMKALLRQMVLSATYRQTSKVTPELLAKDPDNRLLARGPRFRLGAETIRDQALFVAGLLSRKMYGPPVKPPQPKLGLSAAFGSGTDWETSPGEDKYRRALYTTWRRSNPYPSMSTFDAPNREVCTVRRDRSNTPLQALVTLNDPVYVEAAQGLARRMAAAGDSPAAKVREGFRLCLSREAAQEEVTSLLKLYARAYGKYLGDETRAVDMATQPLGKLPAESEPAEMAAWTVVANTLLNLDEFLMKR